MKKFHYLSGLARSGSTLLGSILSQHPLIHVTPTSPLLDLMNYMNQALNTVNQQYTFDFDTVSSTLYRDMYESFFKNIDKPIIVDKHRGWIKNIKMIELTLKEPAKVLCTYRPIPEVITSFLKLMRYDANNFIDAHLIKDRMKINLENRCSCMWNNYIREIHDAITFGLEFNRHNILMLAYDDIVKNTTGTLELIEDFLEVGNIATLPLNHIKNTCAEAKDDAWGLKDLHKIRSTIFKTSDDARQMLGDELFNYYSQFNLQP